MTEVTIKSTLVEALKYGNIPESVYGFPAIPIDPFQMVSQWVKPC